eukprot:gnl/MRDRNA2_/MRDRNA2_58607_c0_seq1.p1 gnl/MRDRNA2_/MRDRNA2_58607_c0~~gnl/MRDRNA2_/MRDRNA2_58607_c0_seq1.p1  ORF type:complete len:494 (-),score=76.44 gnl/MRDRNA2_/MRDRNA2_58607_c0_seq1:747-2228(-)
MQETISSNSQARGVDEIKWVRFLFFETLLLFFVQVILGFAYHSLTLLADAPHAAVDCLTYGFNFWVERTKARSEKKSKTYIYVCSKPVAPWKVDAGASAISVSGLILATAFVVFEAVEELKDPEAIPEAIQVYQLRGSILLLFAILSTVGNIVVLAMRMRLKPTQRHSRGGSSQDVSCDSRSQNHGEEDSQERKPHEVSRDDNECRNNDLDGQCSIPAGYPAGNPDDPEGIICGQCDCLGSDDDLPENSSFSQNENPVYDSGSQSNHDKYSDNRHRSQEHAVMSLKDLMHSLVHPGCDGNHGSLCQSGCSQGRSLGAPDDSKVSNQCDHLNRSPKQCEAHWAGVLHGLVHPGCDGNHSFSCGHDRSHSKPNPSHGTVNLNVDSALLHLWSDIFRGVAIFIVAVLIKCSLVKSARKADAVCALLVAGFILLGTLALFQKAFSVFGCSCLGGGHRYKAFFEDGDEIESAVETNQKEVQGSMQCPPETSVIGNPSV